MPGVISDDVLARVWISTVFGLADLRPTEMRLYQNDYTPVPGVTLPNMTECDFGGYAPFDMGVPGEEGADVVNHEVNAPVIPSGEFVASTSATSQTVYGVYLTQEEGTVLLCAARFDAPRTMHAGDTLTVPLSLLLRNITGG